MEKVALVRPSVVTRQILPLASAVELCGAVGNTEMQKRKPGHRTPEKQTGIASTDEGLGSGRRCSGATVVALGMAGTLLSASGGWAQATPTSVDRLLAPQKVLVEIFQMEGSPRLEVEQVIEGKPVSLAGIFAPGGLQLEFRETPVQRVTPAHLETLRQLVETLSPPPSSEHWYAAILVASSGEFGITSLLPSFDRRLAIVYAEEHRKFGAQAPLAMFHSAAHELTHMFNLHHADWEGTSFDRDSTLEGFSRPDTVRWHLSAASLEHLRHAPYEYVRPDGVRFGIALPEHLARHQSTPREDFGSTAKEVVESLADPESPPAEVHSLGPMIIINSDSDEQTTTREKIQIFLKVAKVGAPLQKILVTLETAEGTQILREVPSPNPNEQAINLKTVKLQVGSNILVVEAVDKGGVRKEERFQILRENVRGKTLAAVFGVQEYSRMAPLKHSLNDARSIRDFLLGSGVEKSRLFYQEDPDVKALRKGLGWLRRTAGERDTVLVYFAGHGAAEGDADIPDSDRLAKYLLPADADLIDLYATALPMAEVRSLLDQIKAGTIVVILDSCFSGAAGGRTVADGGTRATLAPRFLARGTSAGKVIISASGANEIAQEQDTLQHGVFTYYLLEGLSGQGDTNGDGSTELFELFTWVQAQVKKRTNAKQVPMIFGEARDAFPVLWAHQ